jgi:hypothetical protein
LLKRTGLQQCAPLNPPLLTIYAFIYQFLNYIGFCEFPNSRLVYVSSAIRANSVSANFHLYVIVRYLFYKVSTDGPRPSVEILLFPDFDRSEKAKLLCLFLPQDGVVLARSSCTLTHHMSASIDSVGVAGATAQRS